MNRLDDIAKLLANRINQEHYVMQYLVKIANWAYNIGEQKRLGQKLPIQNVSNLLIARDESIRFARWILKYAKDDFDKDNTLCHKYEGKHYTTAELYDIYANLGY